MTGLDGDEAKGRELVPDAFRELDDTLADGQAPAAVPDEAKPWLADQRFLHGLLRAMHSQDAAAREGRIAAILARVDTVAARPARHWLAVVAAAFVLACLGVWWSLPASLPTADAAVQRAVAELARDVARRFRVAGKSVDAKGNNVGGYECALVTRPGGRLRASGRFAIGGFQSTELTLGTDGTEFWFVSANGKFRRSGPLAERDRLMQMFGDSLDLGFLDLHELVTKLPADFELAVVGREVDAAGRQVLRVEATRKPTDTRGAMRQAWLLCDEETGMVTRLEAEVEFRRGASRQLSIEYLGEEPPGLVDFQRPW
jgi:hypothetical protein